MTFLKIKILITVYRLQNVCENRECFALTIALDVLFCFYGNVFSARLGTYYVAQVGLKLKAITLLLLCIFAGHFSGS